MTPVHWLFGLPSSGKTTLARALSAHLSTSGRQVVLLDGDELRAGICSDLGFSDADRSENLRRAAHMARLLAEQGHAVICAFVTPKERHRVLVRQILGEAARLIYIDCPLEVCICRDVKGLYARAAARQMSGMTGLQDEFETPLHADAAIPTHQMTVSEAVANLIALVAG